MNSTAQTKVLPSGGGLMNKDWKYTNAANTNVRVTFDKVRDALVVTKQMSRLKGMQK